MTSQETRAAGQSAAAGMVLVAAGRSARMSTELGTDAPRRPRKPWVEVNGEPLVHRSLRAFEQSARVREVVLVAHAEDLARARKLIDAGSFPKLVRTVIGGATRTDSVRAGVAALGSDLDIVGVHDAARPMVRIADIEACIDAALEHGAALLATPVRDTIKQMDEGCEPPMAARTVPREPLWAAQTPQCFHSQHFRELLDRAARQKLVATDDASLWERYIGPVALVDAPPTNFKITTNADLELLRALVDRESPSKGTSS